MITTIVVHPNILNLARLSQVEKNFYLEQLITWCKFCRPKNSIIIFDKQQKIEKEIYNYINNETKTELKKKLTTIWKMININVFRSKLSSKLFNVNDTCKLCFRLVDKNLPEFVFVQDNICDDKHCKKCFHELINNSLNIQYSNKSDSWGIITYNYSDVPDKYDFDSFVEYTKFKNLIKYCDDFTLYDKNIIPEDSNIISENYKYNLGKFIRLFRGANINLEIITLVKKTQLQEAENKIVETIKIINEIAKENNVNLTLKVLVGADENNLFMEQIHNRYIFTNLFSFSIDRGLDIINKTSGLNRSFDINIIDEENAEKFKNYLSKLRQYN